MARYAILDRRFQGFQRQSSFHIRAVTLIETKFQLLVCQAIAFRSNAISELRKEFIQSVYKGEDIVVQLGSSSMRHCASGGYKILNLVWVDGHVVQFLLSGAPFNIQKVFQTISLRWTVYDSHGLISIWILQV